LLLLLHPMAPHMTSEAWEMLNADVKTLDLSTSSFPPCGSPLAHQPWPVANEQDIIDERVIITVMIQGKRRGEIEMDANDATDEQTVVQRIEKSSIGQKYLQGKQVKKIHFVADRRIINFVL